MSFTDALGELGSSYSSTNPMPFIVIGVIIALALTVLLGIFVLPEKRRAQLGNFFRVVADIFNFKGLIIEKILKYLYIFFTLFNFLIGFFMLFWTSFGRSMALQGLLVMIISPFATRIVFECMMLFILLVKNVIQINRRLNGDDNADMPEFKPSVSIPTPGRGTAETAPEAPAANEAPSAQPSTIFCPHCGTKYDTAQGSFCPNCGKQP